MTEPRSPFAPTPAQAARNDRVRAVLRYIDGKAVAGDHGYRARVRLASLHGPGFGTATVEDVDQVLEHTAPPKETLEA